MSFIVHSKVVVYNRFNLQERLSKFNVSVGYNPPDEAEFDPDENEYCGGHVPNSEAVGSVNFERLEVICVNPIYGRYVTIRIPGSTGGDHNKRILTLCEVLVYAEPSKTKFLNYRKFVSLKILSLFGLFYFFMIL